MQSKERRKEEKKTPGGICDGALSFWSPTWIHDWCSNYKKCEEFPALWYAPAASFPLPSFFPTFMTPECNVITAISAVRTTLAVVSCLSVSTVFFFFSLFRFFSPLPSFLLYSYFFSLSFFSFLPYTSSIFRVPHPSLALRVFQPRLLE